MYNRIATFISFALISLTSFSACTTTKTTVQEIRPIPTTPSNQVAVSNTYRFAFYNVENLMDTLDNPITADDEFTPQGANKWTAQRYDIKLKHLAKVIAAMDCPAVLGLTEIENAQVVKDLLGQKTISKGNYGFVHYDSPDRRGIDVAFAYNKELVKVIESEKIGINFPEGVTKEAETTRDILHVKATIGGNPIHFFVNHWSSRRGGAEASEPKRFYAASVLRKTIDAIQKLDANAKIVVLGDFNDEPSDRSVVEILKASAPVTEPYTDRLYDIMAPFQADKKGSYYYKGQWDMIDNIVVSGSVLSSKGSVYCQNTTIFKDNFMLYTDKSGVASPSRTYGGTHYFGGYSDHLPVFVEAIIKSLP
jgi:predicted extracellular nuclease